MPSVYLLNDRVSTSRLAVLDVGLERVSLRTIADRVEIEMPDGRTGRMPTNDMFLVAEPDGVAICHFLSGHGHRVFRVDLDGRVRATVGLGGGRYRHANGSSAFAIEGGYVVLATENLMSLAESSIRWIETDADWSTDVGSCGARCQMSHVTP